MYRKRFRGFKRRSYRSGGRSGVSTRKADRPTRWNWGNFHITQQVTLLGADSEPFNNVVVSMARVFDSFADPTTSEGRTLIRSIRGIDVGGMVWDAGFDWATRNQDPDSPELFDMFGMQLLVSDRLDSDGFPVSVGYDWGRSTTPVSSSNTQLSTTEIQDAPSRIHHRWCDRFQGSVNVFSSGENVLSNVQVQPTFRARRSKNLRLKVRLDQEHGLFFHFQTRKGPGFTGSAVERGFLHWVNGSIYYKWVF